MADATECWGLPLLQAGQSQKEITHNEAIVRADALLHLAVESRAAGTPPAAPVPGQSWIVAPSASGDWAGHGGDIAAFQAGGWSFLLPREGCLAWVRDEGRFAIRTHTGWRSDAWPAGGVEVGGARVVGSQQAAIATPSGGMTVDAEARMAIEAILAALRTHGLIANSV